MTTPSSPPHARYFDRPSTSITATTNRTSTSSIPTHPRQVFQTTSTLHPIRLFFSGRDLPEPDSRSRAAHALVYHAQQLPTALFPTRSSSVSDSPSTPTKHPDMQRQLCLQPPSNCTPPAAASQQSPPAKTISIPPLRKSRSNILRSHGHVAKLVAPQDPHTFVSHDGTLMFRSAWEHLGSTDIARKNGRDVEFATSFAFNYVPEANQILRVAFFDATSSKLKKHRMIATAEFQVSLVVALEGRPMHFPLSFLPMSEKDARKSTRIPHGALVVAAEIMSGVIQTFRLDVECNRILRAKSLGISSVKRVFYCVHAVLDKTPKSDKWVMLSRSRTVEMIHRKRDGGSLEYNYFSSRRLIAMPGIIIEDDDTIARRVARVGHGNAGTSASSVRFINRLGHALGFKQKERFFSLPGADLVLTDPATRLKISLYQDNGMIAGFEMIADTEFSIVELRTRQLGMSSPVRVHANTIGKAILKYVECGNDPSYFCLSLLLQGSR